MATRGPLDEKGQAVWHALQDWLSQHEEGQSLLARLKADPRGPMNALVEWLKDHSSQAPPKLATLVTGGNVEKLVNIAQAELVNIYEGEKPVSVRREYLEGRLQSFKELFVEHMVRGGEGLTEEQAMGRYVKLLTRRRKELGEREEPETPLSEYLDQHHARLVIFGEAGSGKTTSLIKLAADAAAHALHDPKAPVPVFTRLKFFKATERGLDELHRLVSRDALLDAKDTATLWREGERPFLFLLDGLNEVGQDFRDSCVLALAEFMQRGPHRYVITSRPEVEVQFEGSIIVDIVRLNEDQIQDFLNRHGAAGLHERMGNRLKGLARNPFMLWALAQSCIGLSEEKLPRNRGQLYENLIDRYIFEIREQKRKQRPRPTKYNYPRVKKPILARLGLTMTQAGVTWRQEDRELRKELQDQLRELRTEFEKEGFEEIDLVPYEFMPSPPSPKGILDEAGKNGVLQQVGGKIEFMHESVQDYYTAVSMTSWSAEEIVAHAPPIVWRHARSANGPYEGGPFFEAIVMLSGLLPDSGDLVRSLITHNPFLAAHCLAGASEVQPAIRDEVQEKWLAMLCRLNEVYRWVACECLAVAGLKHDAVIDHLIAVALLDDSNTWDVGYKAAEALRGLDSTDAISRLVEAAFWESNDHQVWAAARTLGVLNSPFAVRLLFDRWRGAEHDDAYRQRVQGFLASISSHTVRKELQNIRNHAADGRDDDVKVASETAIAELESWEPVVKADVQELLDGLNSLMEGVRADSEQRLAEKGAVAGEIAGKSVSQLIDSLENDSPAVREVAVEELTQRRADEAIAPLIEALWRETDTRVMQAMIDRLNRFSDETEILRMLNSGLESAHKWVRARSVSALSKFTSDEAILLLIAGLDHSDNNVRERAATALGELEAIRAVPNLVRLLQEDDDLVRQRSASALGRIGSSEAVPALIKSLKHATSSDVVRATIQALGQIKSEIAVGPLVKMFLHANECSAWELNEWERENLLLEALMNLESESDVTALLMEAIRDEDSSVRLAAVEGLSRKQSDETEELLIEVALSDPDQIIRGSCAHILGELQGKLTATRLIRSLGEAEVSKRAAAADALGIIGDEGAVAPLLSALEEEARSVRVAAARALLRIREEESLLHAIKTLDSEEVSDQLAQEVADARQALAKAIGFAILAGNHAEVIGLTGKWLPALPEYEVPFYFARGIAFEQSTQLEDALECFDNLTKLEPNDASAHVSRAGVLSALNRYDEALVAARKACELEPEDPHTRMALGWCAYRTGSYEESVENSRRALSLAPEGSPAGFNLGLALLAMKRPRRALKAYQQAIKLFENRDPKILSSSISAALDDLDDLAESEPDLVSEIQEIRQLLDKDQKKPLHP